MQPYISVPGAMLLSLSWFYAVLLKYLALAAAIEKCDT